MIEKVILNKFFDSCPEFVKQDETNGGWYINWKFTSSEISIDMDEKAVQDRKFTKNVLQDRDILI